MKPEIKKKMKCHFLSFFVKKENDRKKEKINERKDPKEKVRNLRKSIKKTKEDKE